MARRLRRPSAATLSPPMPPRDNISVVVPLPTGDLPSRDLPSCDFNTLKSYDEDYSERAFDTILSEQAELETPQGEMDDLSIQSPFAYGGTPLSTKLGARKRRKSDQSRKTEEDKPPHPPAPAPSTPPVVLVPSFEDDAIFASVGEEKRLEILMAIAKMPFMSKHPARRSERIKFIKDIRDLTTEAGMEKSNTNSLIEYVRLVYFDEYQITLTVDNAFTFGDEINDLDDAHTKSSHRKRCNSSMDLDSVEKPKKSKKSKKSERRHSKTKQHSHMTLPNGDLTAAMNGHESPNVSEPQENCYTQVDEPSDHEVLKPRGKRTKTAHASPGKSSDIIDLTETAPNEDSHSRRSTSPHHPRENGHPVKASKKHKSSKKTKSHKGLDKDQRRARKRKDRLKRDRRKEEKRRASMRDLDQPEDSVDAVVQEPILPSTPKRKLTDISPSPSQRNLTDSPEKRGAIAGYLEQPEDAVDAVVEEPILPSTPIRKFTGFLPYTPQRNLTDSPRKRSPFASLSKNPAEWPMDF